MNVTLVLNVFLIIYMEIRNEMTDSNLILPTTGIIIISVYVFLFMDYIKYHKNINKV